MYPNPGAARQRFALNVRRKEEHDAISLLERESVVRSRMIAGTMTQAGTTHARPGQSTQVVGNK